MSVEKRKKQAKNLIARQKYINTMRALKIEPVKGWRSLNAKQCLQLSEQAYNNAPKRKKRKILKLLGADKDQIKVMLAKA